MKMERTASKRRGRMNGYEKALAWRAVQFEAFLVLVVLVFESDRPSRAHCSPDEPP